MVTKTLIGLACLIANRGPSEAETAVLKLSPADQTQIQDVIDSGVCLPASFESLLVETAYKIERGDLPRSNPLAGPSESCFTQP